MCTQQPMIERRLDELEQRLPALPAASLRVQRAIVGRLMSAGADTFNAVQDSTRWAVKTVAGTTKTAGQQTAAAGREAVEEVVEDAVEAMEAVEDVIDPSVTPTGESFEELTKAQLYRRASSLDIPGRSSMNKIQLIEALSHV